MNQEQKKTEQKKTGLQLRDWKLWFRLGTIGCLLFLSAKAEAQDLKNNSGPSFSREQLVVDSPKTVKKNGKAVLLIPIEQPVEKKETEKKIVPKKEVKNTGLPVLMTPSKKNGKKEPAVKKNPAVVAPMPVIPPMPEIGPLKKPVVKKPTVKKPVIKKPIVKKPVVKKPVVQKEIETEQWSILITPGVSSHPRGKSTPSLTTFQLERGTGRMLTAPESHLLEKGIDDDALPTITPNSSSNAEHSTSAAKKAINVTQYEKIYQAIPYNPVEYRANPAYRHEATMEVLFGELRPTVIHKQMPKRVYNQPRLNEAPPRRLSSMPLPWSAYGYSPYYSRYGYGFPPYHWSTNSTYRKYRSSYGPLYHRYGYPYGFRSGYRYGSAYGY